MLLLLLLEAPILSAHQEKKSSIFFHPNSIQQTFAAWRTVFLISSAVYLVFAAVFAAFGSGEVQPWNYVENEDENKEGKSTKIEASEKVLEEKNK